MDSKKALLGRACLIGATLLWGSSFVVLKTTLDTVPTLWVLAIRFTGAALLLGLPILPQLRRIDRGCLKSGALMGLALYAAYTLQTFGLEQTTPGKNAFLTATYCVIVPFLHWAFSRRRPDGWNLLAAGVCLAGMALVSLSGDFSVGAGEALTMCCGLFYALHIIFTSRAVERYPVGVLTALQFAVAAAPLLADRPVLRALPAVHPGLELALDSLPVRHVHRRLLSSPDHWAEVQPRPRPRPSCSRLESVFGTLISVVFYHEQLTVREFAGFALIFAAVLISETKLEFLRRKRALT